MATKNYEAIARKKIKKPSSTKRKPRVLVYSRNKKGKTRFCITAKNVLVLDPENGTDEFKKTDPDVWPVESWSDIDEAYNFLKSSREAREKYKWVAVDGTTRMSNMSLRYIMHMEEERNLERRPGIVDRRDYAKAGELFKGMLLNFQTLPYGIIYTAQERMEQIEGMEESDEDAEDSSTMMVPDLPKGARGALNSIVDVIGRLYVVDGTKKVRVNGEITERTYRQRRLWLADHSRYDTGSRSEFKLPDYLKDPTVDKLINLIRTGDVNGGKEARS